VVRLKQTVEASSESAGASVSPLKKIRKPAHVARQFVLLGDVQRHVLEVCRPRDQAARKRDHLHPSDLAKSDWCQRAAYWALKRQEPYSETSGTFVQEEIFSEGHDIHHRHQGYLWEMGILDGLWSCRGCSHVWWGTSPLSCPQCDLPAWALRYEEVPVSCPELLIEGSGDGLVQGRGLVEYKSLGKGTLRLEAPEFLKQHTYRVDVGGVKYTWADVEGLWTNLHQPFISHLRQAFIYIYCLPPELSWVDKAIFIYQNKWNQQCKEFVVRYSFEVIRDRIKSAEVIAAAMLTGAPPVCSQDYELGSCPACKGEDNANDEEEGRVLGGQVARSAPNPGQRRVRVRSSGQTRAILAHVAKQGDSAQRRVPRRPVS